MDLMTVTPAVYGPVRSWRFGQSLGIDLLGAVSTCSFQCRYCQLGTIERLTCDRTEFVPTQQVATELHQMPPAAIDVVTFSGSGEPTLARNLAAVIAVVRQQVRRPIVVLTNGTLLGDRTVRQDLAAVDIVAVKIDAVTAQQWQALNRPATRLNLEAVFAGIMTFREMFKGHLAIQTMVMAPWSQQDEERYKTLIQALSPDEVQLNTPLRPRPLTPPSQCPRQS
ncbi:MAG: radical SAM protein [Leptolyngbya sp. SIOISBB]|nr:radical SAM protein [Leptolyngbya sp. SIOISBB]